MPNPYLIIANGEKLSAERLQQLAAGRTVIACDGAINDCLQHGIHPDVVLGDFDSAGLLHRDTPRNDGSHHSSSSRAQTRDLKIPDMPSAFRDDKNNKTQILHTPDQNKTDSEKALLHALENGADDIILCQAMGDRTDHSLINLGLLSRYHDQAAHLTLAREHEIIRYVNNDTITAQGNIGDPIAILGFPLATVTTSGLAYECEQLEISVSGHSSGCNALAKKQATIEISGDALVNFRVESPFI